MRGLGWWLGLPFRVALAVSVLAPLLLYVFAILTLWIWAEAVFAGARLFGGSSVNARESLTELVRGSDEALWGPWGRRS